MNISMVDILCIILYIAVVSILGMKIFTNTEKGSFLASSRKLTLPSFVMSLVASWYGLILGVGEMIFYYGITAWIVNGLIWYAIYAFFAIFMAEKIHKKNTPTLSVLLEDKFGSTMGKISGIVTAIMASPASYILSLVIVIELLLSPLNLISSLGVTQSIYHGGLLLIVTLLSGLYIWFEGYKAVIKTDILQFILMFVGFTSLLIFSIGEFGGFSFLTEKIDSVQFTIPGNMGWQVLFVWGFLALWTFLDPSFYQRCYTAKTGTIAKKGIFWSLLFWFIFDMLTLITGLYSLAAFPEGNPLHAYLTLADNVLPIGVKGVFITAVLAIIMSTIDSFLFASSSIISTTFIKKKFPKLSEKKAIQGGIIITLLCSFLLGLFFESIILIIYSIGTVGVSMLLFPTFISLFCSKSFKAVSIITSTLLAGGISIIWMIHGWMHLDDYGFPQYLYAIEPMYPGLSTSMIVLLIFFILKRK